jgi:hypothetical protein
VWFCQNSIRAVHAGRFRSSARQSRLSGALKTCVHRGQIFYGQAKEPVRPENSCRELSAFGKEIDGVQRRRSTVNDNAACAALGARHAQAVAHRSASADGYAPPVILVGFMIDRQLVAQREDLELQRGARITEPRVFRTATRTAPMARPLSRSTHARNARQLVRRRRSRFCLTFRDDRVFGTDKLCQDRLK